MFAVETEPLFSVNREYLPACLAGRPIYSDDGIAGLTELFTPVADFTSTASDTLAAWQTPHHYAITSSSSAFILSETNSPNGIICSNNPVNRTDPFGLRDVVIQFYYNLTAGELPAAAQKEVERIYLDAFNKYGKTKEHTLKFEWKESKECPGDTGYSGGNLFGFNPTQARFFLDQSNKMKVIGYNPRRWTAYINATGIREQATDYNVGMGVTIAHETGLHGLANKTDLSGANANGFVDTSMGAPSSGAPVFSPNIGKAIMDALDLD